MVKEKKNIKINVICWFSTNWPFSPSFAAAAQLLCIFNECVSCYFWPGRSPHKLSHSTVFPFSLSLCVSVCVQMWLVWKVEKKKRSLCTCIYHAAVHAARCGFVLCSWYMTLHVRMHACVHWTKCEQPACVCVCVEERDRVCVYMCVKQMSCVPFCSTDWLVFVAAPSCRRAWPRASLSARTSHASTALICQLQGPSPAPNNTHSLTGPASSAQWRSLTHAYLPCSLFFFFCTHAHLLCVDSATHTHATGLSNTLLSSSVLLNIFSSYFLSCLRCITAAISFPKKISYFLYLSAVIS